MKTKLMTKLALVAAVVALGLASQAEMLWWKATGIKSSTEDKQLTGNALTGADQYIAYIFADTGSGPTTGANAANMFTTSKNPITSLSTIKGMLANGDDITDLAFYNATATARTYETAKGRLNSYTAGTATTAGTASYDYRVGWIGVKGVVNLFAVILDGKSFSDAKNYMIAQTTVGDEVKEVLTQKTTSNYDGSGMGTLYFDWGSQENNSWYKIGTVPEPTSGILLALGVAALALKRKHAA